MLSSELYNISNTLDTVEYDFFEEMKGGRGELKWQEQILRQAAAFERPWVYGCLARIFTVKTGGHPDQSLRHRLFSGLKFHRRPDIGENLFHRRLFGHAIGVDGLRTVDPQRVVKMIGARIVRIRVQ